MLNFLVTPQNSWSHSGLSWKFVMLLKYPLNQHESSLKKFKLLGKTGRKYFFSTRIECAILFPFVLYQRFFVLYILLLKYQYQFYNTIIDHQLVSLKAFETNQLSKSGKLFKLHVIRGFIRISETAIFWYQCQQVNILRFFWMICWKCVPSNSKKKPYKTKLSQKFHRWIT